MYRHLFSRILEFLVLWGLIFVKVMGQIDTSKQEIACFGNAAENRLQPSCPTGYMIVIRELLAMTKLQNSGCPEEFTSSGTVDSSCCEWSENDCKMTANNSISIYYDECSGQQGCNKGVTRQRTTCKDGDYLENSNYMIMNYDCIKQSSVLNFNSEMSITGITKTYITNNGFPSAVTSSSIGTCYVTSCRPGITVSLVDMRLSLTDSGQCGQNLTITDGSSIYEVNCMNNNYLTVTDIYTSVTSSLHVTFSVESTANDSYISIEISGDGVNLSVYCGINVTFEAAISAQCETTTAETDGTNQDFEDTVIVYLQVILAIVAIATFVTLLLIVACILYVLQKIKYVKTKIDPRREGHPILLLVETTREAASKFVKEKYIQLPLNVKHQVTDVKEAWK